MKNISFKQILPHVISVTMFLIITMAYFQPLMKGKELRQGDIMNYKGMSKEIFDFRDQYHSEPLWTNSMFGGMPAYQITVMYYGNLVRFFDKVFTLWLPHPAGLVFLYLFGFYILLMTLKVDPWLGVLGAIAFAFSSYFFIIIDAGHNTKAHAIGYMAPVLAGVLMTFRGRYLLGGALTAFFMSLELYANHPQIAYYLMLLVMVYGIVETVKALREKKLPHIAKTAGILLVAILIAVGSNLNVLLCTYEYGKYSTRGGSELTSDKENKTSGLDKKYATDWSYGIGETMTLLIPDFKGGGSEAIGTHNQNALKDVAPDFKTPIAQSGDAYWGDQPFTSGPVYVGAIVMFLFVFACFVLDGSLKWALIIGTILSVFLAWGRNFETFNYFMLDHFPGYNKFRTVSMAMVIAELCIPLLAILGLDKFLKTKDFFNSESQLKFISKPIKNSTLFYISLGFTAGIAFIYFVLPGMTSFFKEGEYANSMEQLTKSYGADVANKFLNNLEIARKAILRSDAGRSFLLILLAALVLFMFAKNKLEAKYAAVALSFFVLVDMAMVNWRYLDNKNFVSKAEVKIPFKPTEADVEILKDTDPDYRVLNLAANTFNDASTAYFHKSIGGYHGAKLKRYQELIEMGIQPNISIVSGLLQKGISDSTLNLAFSQTSVLNMLNTRYVVVPYKDQQGNNRYQPLKNYHAFGNAWFVNQIKSVDNADAEIAAMAQFNPRSTAVVDKRFNEQLTGLQLANDTSATIKLNSYKANELVYESNSTKDGLAVFSEIYYPDGWNAYVDGQLTPHMRADYVLRAMKVPAGKHNIIFKFEPATYYNAEKISLVCSSLLLLSVAGIAFMEIKKKEVPSTK